MIDYGFELPDTRHSFYSTDGELVNITVVRHYYQNDEDDETLYDCSFNITKGGAITELPKGCCEDKALQIAHQLYEEDVEATNDWLDTQSIYEAECRAGA